MQISRKYLVTGTLVLVAVLAVLLKYWDYVVNPWTRDGQVRAEVIQVTPRVSGPIVTLPIRDNQFVKAGDLLFEIDPRTYQASLDQAQAQLDQTGDNVVALEKQVEASRAGVQVAQSSIEQARSAIAQLEATIAKNKAEYERQQELLPKRATSQKSVERARPIMKFRCRKSAAPWRDSPRHTLSWPNRKLPWLNRKLNWAHWVMPTRNFEHPWPLFTRLN